MITLTLILLAFALLCGVLALIGISARIDLTALGLVLVVLALLLGNVD